MKSQSLIVRINDLIDQHGGGFTKCTDSKCKICNEIKRLRKQLLQDEKEKPLKGVEKKLTKPLKERITKERYLQLKKRGYTDKTIAKEYGVSATAIVKWKKENLSKEELTNSFDDISTPIVNEQKPDFNKNEQEK
ncbi:hypothetical protein NST81_02785 [Bacillus sp. FSL W8-0223]|uniref:hypothetical protein n=1 Tax=Bacillus sp. FSL W8-0223 TaxID=2954595 RepID=UPI0030F56733